MIQHQLITTAREWIGTPYHHQAAAKGKDGGCDCIGLLRGVYAEVTGTPIIPTPPYTPYWAEETRNELLVENLKSFPFLKEIDVADLQPGDIFVARIKDRGIAKHCGFVSYNDMVIHAYSGHSVIEQHFPMGRRLKYAFRVLEA